MIMPQGNSIQLESMMKYKEPRIIVRLEAIPHRHAVLRLRQAYHWLLLTPPAVTEMADEQMAMQSSPLPIQENRKCKP
jgi:hypothetical protein